MSDPSITATADPKWSSISAFGNYPQSVFGEIDPVKSLASPIPRDVRKAIHKRDKVKRLREEVLIGEG